jgi:hypothetical protein
MFRLFLGITILLLFISCSEQNLPKPKAFLKLEYGEKAYVKLTKPRPYSFEVSDKIILKDILKKWLKIILSDTSKEYGLGLVNFT